MGRETVVGPKSACHERNKLPKCPCQCFPFFEAIMMHTSHSQSKQHSQPTICQSGEEENIIWPTPCYFQIIFTWHHGTFNKKGFRTVIRWLQKSMALISLVVLSKFHWLSCTQTRETLQDKVFELITTEHAKGMFSCNAPVATFSWAPWLARGAWQKWVTMHVSYIAPNNPCLVEACTANSEQWTVGVVVLVKSRACSPCCKNHATVNALKIQGVKLERYHRCHCKFHKSALPIKLFLPL